MEHNKHNLLSEELFQTMVNDQKVRKEICRQSFLHFFHFYFSHYIKYETATFQKEIINNLDESDIKSLFIVAFRGSSKSTMVTTAYPIWAILGKQEKRFVVIFCQTKAQAKQHSMNVRQELENNELLKKDLGPFQEESDEWGSQSLVFSNTKSRITFASTEQSIRGIRHNQHRPDLIICDDVEDVASTKTREGRDKTFNWLKGEVIPTGDKNTRTIVVGNLLHEDSLLMRLKEDIENNKIDGKFMHFPLINEKGICLWPGKYPTIEDIEIEKRKIGNEIAWQREYLLRILPADDQVIHPSWIQYYDVLPPKDHAAFRSTYAGVDLAISEKDSADFTAIVAANVYGREEKLRIYILPNPIIKRATFPGQIELIKQFKNQNMNGDDDKFFVENVGYQDALTQTLQRNNINAEGVRPNGDKRTRLSITSALIKSGVIKFPRQGAEKLIEQLVGFGVEKYDDAADAFSLLISKISEIHSKEGTIIMAWFSRDGDGDDNIVYFNDYIDIENPNDDGK